MFPAFGQDVSGVGSYHGVVLGNLEVVSGTRRLAGQQLRVSRAEKWDTGSREQEFCGERKGTSFLGDLVLPPAQRPAPQKENHYPLSQ